MSEFPIRDRLDILYVQGRIRELSARLGFAKQECTELAIVASELTSNILKYGVRGSLQVEPVADSTGRGICLIARDCGPPFRDLAMAMQDGHDDRGPIDPMKMLGRGGIGGGLGAVLRLTHSFHVEQAPAGKVIRAVRYLNKPQRYRTF